MKRTLIVVALVAFVATSAFAQLRIDMGVTIPRGAGVAASGSTEIFTDFNTAISQYIIPLPEAGLYYQLEAGPVRLGLGARVFTFILVSAFWPNAYAELDLGPVTLMGQVGGGWFGVFGIVPFTSSSGDVFLPDLSVWYRFGESFRVGVGAMGMYLPDLAGDAIPFVFYIGGKFSFVFD